MLNSCCLPRFIRLRDAPNYLGMDRNRFNTEARPHLIEIPIGTQGIAFDRLDLDIWADNYKKYTGKPPANSVNNRMIGSIRGIIPKKSSSEDFDRAVLLSCKKIK